MASAPIFSQEKATSPAQKGSALKPRRKGRDEGVSSSVKALQTEETSQNETSSAFLGTSESLPPLSPANEDEDRAKKARNARYSLLRELSRNIWNTKNLSINNFSISLPESDEGSSQMRESQVS